MSEDNQQINFKDFAQGVALPFELLETDPIPDGAKEGHFIEIHCGGFGSEISAHPSIKNQFYALTDRGPNTTYNVNGDNGKIFLDPTYTPKIGLFELSDDGKIYKLKEILLKNPAGSAITGLPNREFGASKETAYDRDGNVLANGTDEYGLDAEGLVALDDGTFWISDEYGPHIVHFDAEGIEIDRINAYAEDSRRISGYLLPAEYANRRQNRGMEGLTITPDQKILLGIMQSCMSNPDATANKSTLTRIVSINLETKAIAQYLYRQEEGGDFHSNTAFVALSQHSFLVAERDDTFYKDNPCAFKRVYKIDLSQATDLECVLDNDIFKQDSALGLTIQGQTLEQYVIANGWDALIDLGIRAVDKHLVVDLVKRLRYPHDKVEGLWVINESHLAVINDDDYGFSENNGVLQQKYLDQAQTLIDANTLYIIDDLDLSPISDDSSVWVNSL